jgi:hypothetical protein
MKHSSCWSIYSDDDRYRGLKNLRNALFTNADDMRERGLGEFDLVDITSFARDGSIRSVYGYRAVAYDTPRCSVIGSMPAECVVRDRRPQRAERTTVDQAAHRRGHPRGDWPRKIEPGSPPTSYLGSTPLLGLGEPQQIAQWR